MRYINGEEIKYDFTKPKTYMRPVFESLEDGHVRLHHIDVEGSMEKCTFARIGHMSNQRRRIFELEEENAKLREFIYNLIIDEERGHNDDRDFREHVNRAHEYGIAQDIEVGK